jgi:hydroxyacylglutathione hydrolase
MRESATIVDARDRKAFAKAHIPGSIWIGTGDSFSSWVGWLTDIDDPLVLIVDDSTDAGALQVELARVGYDRVVGWMRDIDGWSASGRELSSMTTLSVEEWAEGPPAQILDVRDYWERDQPTVADAVGVHLPDIDAGTLARFDLDRPVGVVCASGYRATIAGSLLERLGVTAVVLMEKGASELATSAAAGS